MWHDTIQVSLYNVKGTEIHLFCRQCETEFVVYEEETVALKNKGNN